MNSPESKQRNDKPSADPAKSGAASTDSSASARSASRNVGDNRAEQRNQKENQVAQLSAANVEESPKMDPGDSAGGEGESLDAGQSKESNQPLRRGALDTQYGTKSATKTSSKDTGKASGRADTERAQLPNPGSSEESSGSERDTMSGPRPGRGS